MTNAPQPREIPAGKVLVAEYGEVTAENRARVEVIKEAAAPRVRSTACLVFSTPGFERAGSVARWTNGFWAVWFDVDGARHGQRFAPTDAGETAARTRFALLTSTQH